MASSRPKIFEVVLLGLEKTGKSSIFECIKGEPWVDDVYTPTIGMNFDTKIIQENEKSTELITWDTSGQERFSKIFVNLYRKASVILLVVDATGIPKINELTRFFKEIQLHALIYLVVNKKDLIIEEESKTIQSSATISSDVVFSQVEKLQTDLEQVVKIKPQPIFCSAKTGVGIDELVNMITDACKKQLNSPPAMSLAQNIISPGFILLGIFGIIALTAAVLGFAGVSGFVALSAGRVALSIIGGLCLIGSVIGEGVRHCHKSPDVNQPLRKNAASSLDEYKGGSTRGLSQQFPTTAIKKADDSDIIYGGEQTSNKNESATYDNIGSEQKLSIQSPGNGK